MQYVKFNIRKNVFFFFLYKIDPTNSEIFIMVPIPLNLVKWIFQFLVEKKVRFCLYSFVRFVTNSLLYIVIFEYFKFKKGIKL